MYKLLTSSQQTSQWMYGFEESTTIRRQEVTNNKTEKGTFFVRIKLKDVFGFADQEKVTYGLGYTLTLKRNNSKDVIIRGAGVDVAKVNVKDISWYIPHYVANLENQQLVLNQILNKDPTELYHTERTVFRKDVNTNNNWTFEVGTSGRSTPTFVIVGFQGRFQIDSQTHDNATFDRASVSNAVCKIGSEKYPDDRIECDYDRDKYDQAYSNSRTFISYTLSVINPTHLLICTNSEKVILFMYSIYPNKKTK